MSRRTRWMDSVGMALVRVPAVLAVLMATCLAGAEARAVVARPSTAFGVVVDGAHGIIPSAGQLQLLGATWERSVVGVNGKRKHRDDWCRGQAQTLPAILLPGTRWIMTFDNQSCSHDAPLDTTRPGPWRRYLNRHYIPDLVAFMNSNRTVLAARGSKSVFEIWNEENCIANHSYIPPSVYAGMLGRANEAVSRWDKRNGARVGVIMGGLCDPHDEMDGNSNYTSTVLRDGGAGLKGVEAIGIHPSYGTVEPSVWNAEIAFYRKLVASFVATTGTHQIWVTEAGATGNWLFRRGQASFARVLLGDLSEQSVPVVIWYAFDDRILGASRSGGWGLFDGCRLLKPAGAVFQQFGAQLPGTPPAGSATTLRIGGVSVPGAKLTIGFQVDVRCPSGAENPWTSLSLTDRVDGAGPANAPRVISRLLRYRTGGRTFWVSLPVGINTVTAAYAGDYQLEAGGTAPMNLEVGSCPGSGHSPGYCPSSMRHTTRLIALTYRAERGACGSPRAAGDTVAVRGVTFQLFAHCAIAVVGRQPWVATQAALLRSINSGVVAVPDRHAEPGMPSRPNVPVPV